MALLINWLLAEGQTSHLEPTEPVPLHVSALMTARTRRDRSPPLSRT